MALIQRGFFGQLAMAPTFEPVMNIVKRREEINANKAALYSANKVNVYRDYNTHKKQFIDDLQLAISRMFLKFMRNVLEHVNLPDVDDQDVRELISILAGNANLGFNAIEIIKIVSEESFKDITNYAIQEVGENIPEQIINPDNY